MSKFYYEQQKNCFILLSFQRPNGDLFRGFVVPLDVLDVNNCIGGLDIHTLQKGIAQAKDDQGHIKMFVKTNNFVVPGIGHGRNFYLSLDQGSVQSSNGRSVIAFPKLLRFLRALRMYGRPKSVDDLTMFGLIKTWNQRPYTHLLSSAVSETPLIDDGKYILNEDGLYASEIQDAFQKDSGICFGYPIISPKRPADVPLSAAEFREMRMNIFQCDADSPPLSKNHSLEDQILQPKAEGGVHVSTEQELLIKTLRSKYQLLANTPMEVLLFLADPMNRNLSTSLGFSINPLFVIGLAEWSGTTIDDISRHWFEDTCNGGERANCIPSAVIHKFDRKGQFFMKLVLSLDHISYPPESSVIEVNEESGAALPCIYCLLEGVHKPVECPLYYGQHERQLKLQADRCCTGCCKPDCVLGRVPHKQLICIGCRENTHVNGACFDEDMMRVSHRPVILRQQFIIAATYNLPGTQVQFIHKELPEALKKFEQHQKDILAEIV